MSLEQSSWKLDASKSLAKSREMLDSEIEAFQLRKQFMSFVYAEGAFFSKDGDSPGAAATRGDGMQGLFSTLSNGSS